MMDPDPKEEDTEYIFSEQAGGWMEAIVSAGLGERGSWPGFLNFSLNLFNLLSMLKLNLLCCLIYRVHCLEL